MIQRLVICICSLLFLATVVFAQELPPLPQGVGNIGDPKKIKAVLAREDEFLNAYTKLDPKLAADLYAEEYLTLRMGDACCIGTKDGQINALIAHRDAKPPYPITSMTNEQVVVHVYGNVAIVTGVEVVNMMFTEEKPPRPMTGKILFMNVWELRQRKWMLVASTHKNLPQSKPK